MRFRSRLIEIALAATLAVVSTAALAAKWGRIDGLSGVRVRGARQRHGKP
ncbi:MAG: hypothetical protein ACE5NW_17110 [Acidiferrobacterales bacterium]